MEQRQQQNVTIVAVPFPAQGHLNQLLHLCHHLSSRGLPIHFASSATHVRQVRARHQGWPDRNSVDDKIKFHELPLPPFPNSPSDPNSTNKFPSHLFPSWEASMQLQSPLASLFRSLSAAYRRLVIVHDPLMSFICKEADAIPNAETYTFQCLSALYQLSSVPDELRGIVQDKLAQEVSNLALMTFKDLSMAELLEFKTRYWTDLNSDAGTVINTFRAIDGEFIELMAELPRYRNKKLWAIGPINPVAVKRDGDECLQWLDKHPAASVLYVSFGSTTSISDEQVEQLAMGLQRSGQPFIWALRDADRGDIFADDDKNQQKRLPDGFEEEIQDVGMIMRGWAPQLEILAHRSTGAFMSHCGWNSCMESLSMGVPIIAWPMHSDQPRNGMMVTDYLKVGVAVRDWDRRKEVVAASEIECSIKKVMVDDEGKEIRKRAESLGEETRLAVGENGSSRTEFDSFVAHITRR